MTLPLDLSAGFHPAPDQNGFLDYLKGRTMEALNTDLVCDAINTAMRELFLQIVYGRSQSAFSEEGLPVGAGLEDLGKGLRSQFGILHKSFLRNYRRHAVVSLLVLAAIITPSGDPFTLMLVFVPLYFLYEFSIMVVKD